METLPGKKPLTKLAYRPPNYESHWIIPHPDHAER
jgi:hypothetical protein